jgi:hypothetical protein
MIELPDWAVPSAATPGYIDFGGFLTPGLGGAVQRLDRMGNRFKLAVSFPPMPSKDRGRILIGRVIRGKTEGLRMEVPLLSFKPGSPGSPKVNGAGQSGRSLVVDGLTPNYTVREGQWLSILHDDRHYLHNVDAEVTANGSGQATLSISPMLRIEPDDNDEVHLARPMIEGFIMGEEWRWEMSLEHNMGIEFEIQEAA